VTLIIDSDFYAPWPRYGVDLSEQWDLIRANTQTLAPIGNAVLLESDDGNTEDAALAGFEFGIQTFPNKFRIVWNSSGEELRLQLNEGTSAVPIWRTAYRVDTDATQKNIFDEGAQFSDITLIGDFYGYTARIEITDGTFSRRGSTLIFNPDEFYLDTDTNGTPRINLAL